ncbi:protein BatD [Flavobacterium salilacus subsp. salilacus]|uniref:BatD family protein n=1 Tax=Flavobacterium TaxID=237 RepID=UPI0010755A52|nr:MULTISPECIES: BatD family protein [Flavobacterium]KAF2515093.1 protein BatD [Flavobacterium salilacus subsp. salilacus]MBE1615886.1 protein BatD [Flavobacterium sp. SaA2.13]
MRKYLLLVLLFCLQGFYAQEVEFTAKPSKTTLGINEKLRVEFTMTKDGDNFNPPSFQGFNAAGPSQMISNSWINGKRSFSKTYTYVLTPTARGTFTIGQASIDIDGETYKTIPFKVTVTAAVAGANDPDAPITENAGKGIHVVAEVSKTNPYVNEPITVVYKLYVSQDASVRGTRQMDIPQFNDFWSQDIETDSRSVQQGMYNGENYRYIVLKRVVLYPQKSGRLEVEPLSMELTIDVPTGRRDFFNRPLMTQTTKVMSSGSKYINVKPLPEKGKPIDFSGAVGSFDFKVTPSKTTLSNGESLQLNVEVLGKGNLKLFNLPKPVVPSALEMYDPEHKEKISIPLSGMQGSISDNYAIIPQNKGKYPIKAMTFSYFDLASGKYKTITTDEIMIDVQSVPGTSAGNETTSSSGVNKQPVQTTEQFRFVALDTKLQPINKKPFFGSMLFYILLFVPFLLIPVIMLLKKQKQARDNDVTGNKIRKNNKLAKKYLSEAKKHLGNKEPFYVALEKALHNFLKAKLNIETSEMAKPNIQELLESRGAKPETIDDFIKIMNSCEFARYAPSSGAAMQQDYDNAVSVITKLEKEI